MSENKNQLVNPQPSPDPKTGPGGTPEGDMQKVDQGTQEKAAEERETSGGYD